MAKCAFNKMKIFLHQDQLKMRAIKCCVCFTLFYHIEACALNKKMEKKIGSLEMWIYRKVGWLSCIGKKTKKDTKWTEIGKKNNEKY